MRLVLDTNVVVSALLWDGPPRRLLIAAREHRATLFTSAPLLAELTRVLERPRFEKKIAASGFTVDEIVDRYAILASVVRPESTPRIAADPDDDVVIGTALAADADLIISGDGHLLDLQNYGRIAILTTAAGLERLATPAAPPP